MLSSTPPSTSQRVSARRSQAERRETTRTQLLVATLQSMIELGYAGTTTLGVERRAGVSRGARIHYFPTKADLMAAAVDHLYDQLSERYDEVFATVVPNRGDAERAASALKRLWSIYQQSEYTAVLELNIAARTDEELRARLSDVRERQRAIVLAAVKRAFPDLPAEVATTLIETCNAAMIGLLVQRGLEPHPNPHFEDAVLGHLGTLVVQHLSAAPATPASTGAGHEGVEHG